MSQTSAWEAFVGTKAPWRERRSTMWTHWKGRRSDSPLDSSAVGGAIGIHGSWTVRPCCFCRRPQCFGELVVGR